MTATPLVSIGLITFQRPEGLRSVLEGLRRQTYTNLEIIVSDNCSESTEVDSVLDECSALDSRVRVFRQPFNIGMEPNHSFVVRQARGEFFVWLHDDDDIPDHYIASCMARFSDGPNVELVGPKADAFMNGEYWRSYWNYSNLGDDTYRRLWNLIPVGYTNYIAFQHYFYGVFRLSTLKDVMWSDGRYYIRETYSLFFRIAEKGCIHHAEDVTLLKYNTTSDLKKWRQRNYVDKPERWRVLGVEMEEYFPMTSNIFGTVRRSDSLSLWQKCSLWGFCLYNLLGALVTQSRTPLWKRLLRVPFRVLRKLLYLAHRALGLIVRQ